MHRAYYCCGVVTGQSYLTSAAKFFGQNPVEPIRGEVVLATPKNALFCGAEAGEAAWLDTVDAAGKIALISRANPVYRFVDVVFACPFAFVAPPLPLCRGSRKARPCFPVDFF